jgi:HSP20 family molecular chaperone IbpA
MNGLRDLGESIGAMVLDGVGRVSARVQARKPLPVDLLESDEAYLVVFDAPGVEMQDVSVDFERGTIRVRIERFRDLHEDYEMLFPGRGLTLQGQVDLPPEAVVDPEGARATLAANGTLRVEIPKEEPAAGGTVEIDTDETVEDVEPEPEPDETAEAVDEREEAGAEPDAVEHEDDEEESGERGTEDTGEEDAGDDGADEDGADEDGADVEGADDDQPSDY